ncbi:uncharacterized protein B0I36DRAFT_354308 [Microdochium trichocladiopsis]|uniref:Uncharacterized protein n=1 Tax=Microdochium trichocladiopsis TaxID=1682393 RepID=A0A9P8XWZ4_9PEZI|nr:uncharacterized protein B0I36DRAFT_354308 [Microdochium trichocladiopsis]KAH7017983.1 hypothetical protein B0I36DRAFT_354308 [Microdochium trichocladiopsis]
MSLGHELRPYHGSETLVVPQPVPACSAIGGTPRLRHPVGRVWRIRGKPGFEPMAGVCEHGNGLVSGVMSVLGLLHIPHADVLPWYGSPPSCGPTRRTLSNIIRRQCLSWGPLLAPGRAAPGPGVSHDGGHGQRDRLPRRFHDDRHTGRGADCHFGIGRCQPISAWVAFGGNVNVHPLHP